MTSEHELAQAVEIRPPWLKTQRRTIEALLDIYRDRLMRDEYDGDEYEAAVDGLLGLR